MTDVSGALNATIAAYDAALTAGDCATLEGLIDGQLIYVHSTGVVDDRSSYLAKIARADLVYSSIQRREARRIEHPNMVILLQSLEITVAVEGVPRSLQLLATSVWTYGTAWRLSSFHSLAAPTSSH